MDSFKTENLDLLIFLPLPSIPKQGDCFFAYKFDTPFLMSAQSYSEIKDDLKRLYLEDERPWLVGFSGGKDSSMVASLIFDVVLGLEPEQRTKEIAVLCTDTRVEIPAIVEMVETTLAKMKKCAAANNLNIEMHLLRPPAEQSFWVSVIGRGYPPPNRVFRWCTSRLKIDPMSRFVEQ